MYNGFLGKISESGIQKQYANKQSTLKPLRPHPLTPFSFVDHALSLHDFSHKTLANGRISAFSKGVEINTLAAPKPTEKGSYGQTHRSADGKRIYKSITLVAPVKDLKTKEEIREWFEEKIREIYQETFTQVVLSMDPDVGQFICKPIQLFHDPSVLRRTRPTDFPNTITLYILMEPIKHTLSTLIAKHGGVRMSWLGPLLYQLGYVLDVLKTKYQFAHRDLHTSNVLIAEGADGTDSIRLIDFGFSCVTYNGVVYRAVEADNIAKGCDAGFDLALFFASLWTYFDTETESKVKELFSGANFNGMYNRDIGMNLFQQTLDEAKRTGGAGFHSFYFYNLTPLNRAFLGTIPILQPAVLREKPLLPHVVVDEAGKHAAFVEKTGAHSKGDRCSHGHPSVDPIVHAFARILGKTHDGAAQRVLDHLSESGVQTHLASARPLTSTRTHFFLNEAATLPEFGLKTTANGRSTAYSKGAEINTLEASTEGGTFGQMHRSTDGKRIYKSITLTVPTYILNVSSERNNWVEEKIRGFYLETFIQVVLASDPDVGQYICKPTQLFRDASIVRGKSGVVPHTLTLYILMEPIKHTFKTLVAKHGGVYMTWLRPLLYQLGDVLDVLHRKYNYGHRDLHTSNILIAEGADGTERIRLIDFGFSCLTYKGVVYREVKAHNFTKGCDVGFDLAIFFTSFWMMFDTTKDPEVEKLFSGDNFNGTLNGTIMNMYQYSLDYNDETGEPEHWAYYAFNLNAPLRAFLDSIPILKPAFLRDKMKLEMDALLPVPGGGGGLRRLRRTLKKVQPGSRFRT